MEGESEGIIRRAMIEVRSDKRGMKELGSWLVFVKEGDHDKRIWLYEKNE